MSDHSNMEKGYKVCMGQSLATLEAAVMAMQAKSWKTKGSMVIDLEERTGRKLYMQPMVKVEYENDSEGD